jgi:8-oxo-dGTP pyrophosphatase MutT (NUDIX family)
MPAKSPRIAVRGIIIRDGRLLLVNAWPGGKSALMCAPGGGVEPGSSMPENLAREVYEETGLRVEVGAPCLVNEFHDPASGFHQIEVFFRCHLLSDAEIDPAWRDPENIVSKHLWADAQMFAELMVKPDSLARVAFSAEQVAAYDPLELVVM